MDRFFYVVAGAFAVAGLVILATVVMCIIHADAIVDGRFKCDADNRVFDLMAMLISSSIALYAGYLRGGPPPPPPPPPPSPPPPARDT